MRRITVWSIVMFLTLATSAHAVVLLSDGFETYNSGALDADLIGGPNQAPNGGPGNPWFGPAPPNLKVVGAGGGLSSGAAAPHSGNSMITANAASDFDQEWVNISNRFNGGNAFTGNVSLDWWFYDPNGAGDSAYRDYAALGNYSGASTAASSGLDYPDTDSNLNHTTVIQRLSLGASNPAGFDNTKYQARVAGATDGLPATAGWFNVGTRSVGWHEGKIALGDPNGASTVVSFYIDGVDVLDHAILTSSGVNVIEINAGFSTTSANFDDVSLTTPTPGDFNKDGKVDAADYVTWRKGLDTTFIQSDYDVWRANFGQPGGSGGGAAANAAVPEPASALLFLVSILLMCAGQRTAES